MKTTFRLPALLVMLGLCLSSTTVFGYAILSHEAVINASWDEALKPLLLKKFPGATEEELMEARAFLYGGAVMPDIGYAPFGNKFFTHLVHYVRTGDFVTALLDEAQNIEEYAFALGFMCHYFSDVLGHALGTNPAVPLLFKKAGKKFGDSVNYEQCPSYHARAEFGFDVLQSAKGNYEPDSYHDFIGFKISEPVLERAFLKTYGLELKDIFRSMTVATKTFRFAVRNMFPTLTKSAWLVRRASPNRLNPLARKKDYIYKMDRKTFKKEFGRPGLKSSAFAVLIFVLPKIGPTAGLKFKTPNPEVQRLFDVSFDAILSRYSGALKTLITQEKMSLENLNWDTGEKTVPGEYELTDETYCDLLLKLEKRNFDGVNAALKESFLKYYSDPAALKAPKVRSGKWKKIEAALERLKTVNIE